MRAHLYCSDRKRSNTSQNTYGLAYRLREDKVAGTIGSLNHILEDIREAMRYQDLVDLTFESSVRGFGRHRIMVALAGTPVYLPVSGSSPNSPIYDSRNFDNIYK